MDPDELTSLAGIDIDLVVDSNDVTFIRAAHGGVVTIEPLEWLVEKAMVRVAAKAREAVDHASVERA